LYLPCVNRLPGTAAKYNAIDQLQIKGTSAAAAVGAPAVVSTVWSVSSTSDVAKPFLVAGAAAAKVTNKLSCVVRLSSLTPGNTYTLLLTAVDATGGTATSTVALAVNEAPAAGSCVVSPSNGYALATAFGFEALNWVDDDLPLT